MYTIILHDINSVDLKNNGSTASKSLTPVARAKRSRTVLFRAVGRLDENGIFFFFAPFQQISTIVYTVPHLLRLLKMFFTF